MTVVVLPLSQEPLWESTGLFLGTLAFPKDEQKARRYALAWCRDGALRTAASDPDYAQSEEPVRWFLVRDKEAEDLFNEANKALSVRKAAYVATQAEFIGALSGRRITHIGGFGERTVNTRENAYVKTNVFLRKPAGMTTKWLIRDIINPSRPVLHAVFALYHSATIIMDETRKGTWNGEPENLSTGQGAIVKLLGDVDIFSTLLDYVERCRLAALEAPALKVTSDKLVQFVAS